jgi:integrase-like protein
MATPFDDVTVGPSPTAMTPGTATPFAEAALLAVARPHIQAMLIAAIDTGMRRGEMLALRFGDIDIERGLIVLRAVTTKSRKSRVVPISTERLRAVLAWLRVDADGDEKSKDTLVFSNEVGEPLRLFHHSWMMTVLKAHGVTPSWSARLGYKGLSEESQEAFRQINGAGTTCDMSTPHGWSRKASHSRKSAICSGTRQSRRPSATTTRRSRTCRSR